ncbi:LPXTG cell wall anchor domain-containing protein [Streptococcus salivarius]|uniref:LPXTG cell wall anchor domain-containing protein n=1 Tax=Streptococcus salivarius TaxID=1304 RepID=UPI001651BBA1|nr:LPXTG cell wall anchor domain-containing protein [Streptococcus salivarius]
MSINKFSKYGIVLVAAITLATTVQTQFGQSSTKVYAEETATSDNDPRLNRMLYLDYALSDDPKISWLTGNVVTPKGYIVQPADEVEGYPYYTITGSNGKKYSVGDVITTEEPGLFGHANYEDDALYYRYYRTNPNSVSEAPAVSETPATSEAPAVSTTPATSEAPAVSTTPATSEAPAVSTTPATSEAPAVSTTPATSEAPAVSTTPATSEAPAVSTTPATSEAPAVSTTPATSEAPAVSTTPATSEAPAVSTTPATSEAPAVSTTPATSEAPANSTAPATSEAPAVSTTPATSLVPTKDNHSMNFVTPSYTQTRSAGIKSETDGKLTSQDLPKTGDTNSKVGMLGMVLVGLGLTSFVYKGRHRRS